MLKAMMSILLAGVLLLASISSAFPTSAETTPHNTLNETVVFKVFYDNGSSGRSHTAQVCKMTTDRVRFIIPEGLRKCVNVKGIATLRTVSR